MSEFPPGDRETDYPGGQQRAGPHAVSTPSCITVCHCVLLISIENCHMLRRVCGLSGMRDLMKEIANRSESVVDHGVASVVGCDLIELWFVTDRQVTVEHVAARIIALFEPPVDSGDGKRQIEVIVAGAVSNTNTHDDVGLIEEAEIALREARIDRTIVVKKMVEQPAAVDRIELADRMADAIAGDEFVLHFQPKVNFRQQRVCGVEALLRWQHPTRGLIMPAAFITIAEESRHIVDLTLWTLRRALIDQQRLAEAGHDVPMFVNISGLVLCNAGFVAEASRLVAGCGDRIGFEITETAVIRDPDTAIANLKRFADIGIVLAIDDYGAGLSSLAYLKQLPAKELKIDKLFVTQLTSSNRDPLIVRSTIDLAHALEMEVVAEGIETVAAMALLSVMGCDMGQGYLISRPLEFHGLLEFLHSDYQSKLSIKFDNPLRHFNSVMRSA